MNLFEISNLEIRLKDLESKTNNASFWEDSKNSTKILKEINEIKAKMNEYAQSRKEKQPLNLPSAGSTFKRGKDRRR